VNRALHVNSFPDYYLIDRKGRVVGADIRNGKVEAAIQRLLEQSPDQRQARR